MSKYLDDRYAARIMKLLLAPNAQGEGNFASIILSLRRLIETLPTGKTKLRQWAVAHRMLMLKLPKLMEESVSADEIKTEYLKMLEFVIENQLVLVEEEMAVKDAMWYLLEDGEGGGDGGGAPVNSVAGIEPTNEPVIDKKRKRLAKIFSRTEENQ